MNSEKYERLLNNFLEGKYDRGTKKDKKRIKKLFEKKDTLVEQMYMDTYESLLCDSISSKSKEQEEKNTIRWGSNIGKYRYLLKEE